MRYSETADPVITLTAGPVNAYPDVLRALSRSVLYDYDPAFQMHYERVVDKASTAMRLKNKALILHGEPVLGLEAAAASLITPQDTVLNLASGVYGKGFGFWAKRYSPNLLEIEVPYNEAITPEAVAVDDTQVSGTLSAANWRSIRSFDAALATWLPTTRAGGLRSKPARSTKCSNSARKMAPRDTMAPASNPAHLSRVFPISSTSNTNRHLS